MIKRTSFLTGLLLFMLSLSSTAFAADPFRKEAARDIGKHTEDAFTTVFLQGNYRGALEPLKLADQKESDEPLAHALRASLAYTEEDWATIKVYALKTLDAAENLKTKDPVRGHLYLAVGHFLDGAYRYEKEGAVSAIQKLQLVFKHFDAAEDVDPKDPELNLIKGYVDLLLAVNLPFSSPDQAIARFKTNASPNYLVNRGIAVAYRDLKKYDKALNSVNKALDLAPDNPEHYYLKGQILRKIGKKKQDIGILQAALKNFSKAVDKEAQLPSFIVKPLKREMRQTKEKIAEIKAARAAK